MFSLEKRQLHFKRIILSSSLYIMIKEYEQPSTWILVKGDQQEIPLKEQFEQILQQFSLKNAFIDVDHDEYGRRKLISILNIENYFNNQEQIKQNNQKKEYLKKMKQIDKLVKSYVLSINIVKEIFNNQIALQQLMIIHLERIQWFYLMHLVQMIQNQIIQKFLRMFLQFCQSKSAVTYALKTEKAIFYAIHEIAFSQKDTNRILDEINEEIWKQSRKGTVIIHCLAGMHRAPCVLVSQVLYRYYVQNQKHLDIDFSTVYNKLSSIRSGVAPLSYIDLIHKYKSYLAQKY